MGQAAQLSQSDKGEVLTLRFEHRKVLEILAQYGSMPFLELTTQCDIGDDKLEEIINDLEGSDMVKVSYRDNILQEIVTLKKRGLEVKGHGS